MLEDSGIIRNPSASLSDLSVRSLSAEGVQFDAVMKIENPNPIALQLGGFDYDFVVAGKSLVSGKQDLETQVAAAGESLLRVPLYLKFADLKSIGDSVGTQDRVAYGLKTTAYIQLPVVGKVAFPVEKTGEVPVPRMPEVAVSRLELKSLGLAGADLALVMRVNNPNAFGINVSHLKNTLKVDGVSWLDTTLSKSIQLLPKRSQQLELPIRLDFLSLGTQLMRRLQNSEPLAYELEGSFVLGSDLPMLREMRLPYRVGGEVPVR
jgi:LEA14-like dessication related protein